MGVGQSRELIGKLSDDNVFLCTNSEELMEMLRRLQEDTTYKRHDVVSEERMDEDIPGGCADECAVESVGEGARSPSNVGVWPSSGPNTDLPGNVSHDGFAHEQPKDRSKSTVKDVCGTVEAVLIPNHYLGDDGLISGNPSVLQVLAASLKLHTLDIAYNALTSNSIEALLPCATAIVGDLTSDNTRNTTSGFLPPNLQTLNLAGNRVGRVGCERLGEFLAQNPPLRFLSLFHNNLCDNDVEPLLQGLRTNSHLRLLNLGCNNLTGDSLRVLLNVLEENTGVFAVVVLDGPYDKKSFVRLKELAREEAIPDKESAPSAHARALLGKKLLCADLAGRVPLPVDLVREVEALLEPRRVAFLNEIQAEQAEAQAAQMNSSSQKRDVGCLCINSNVSAICIDDLEQRDPERCIGPAESPLSFDAGSARGRRRWRLQEMKEEGEVSPKAKEESQRESGHVMKSGAEAVQMSGVDFVENSRETSRAIVNPLDATEAIETSPMRAYTRRQSRVSIQCGSNILFPETERSSFSLPPIKNSRETSRAIVNPLDATEAIETSPMRAYTRRQSRVSIQCGSNILFPETERSSFSLPPITLLTTHSHTQSSSDEKYISVSTYRKRPSIFSVPSIKTAVSVATTVKRVKGVVVTGRVLNNGFERMTIAPSNVVRGSRKYCWRHVTGPPCRLRACWCDARAAVAQYSGKLHYHCKYEASANEGDDMDVYLQGNARKSPVGGRGRSRQRQKSRARSRATGAGNEEVSTLSRSPASSHAAPCVVYEGCKGTSHRCESLEFCRRPLPDKRPMSFFSSLHPHTATGLQMHVVEH
uniref:Putative leucine-rich repeat protein (LRRP) n=1 Tax=Trypanosoma vivax (strain Y486) TaxID=1055687 RepID=G0TZH4_TRYVY|nr:putative leucine-rich repeat protein (LRRP), fragment [Trypanosoma vivax Y486]